MRLVLLKSTKFAHQSGYYLYQGRWHKTEQGKPVPKNAPQASHPEAAGKHLPIQHLTDAQWEQLKLPESNTNAGTFNKQLQQLKEYSDSGNVTAILGMSIGSNTYGKKISIIANHLLGLHGSEHKVSAGQKAGTHAAVQAAPEIKAEAQAQKPEKSAPVEQTPGPVQEKPAPSPEKKADAEPVDITGLSSAKISAAYNKLYAGKLSISEFKQKVKSGEMNGNGKAILDAIAEHQAANDADAKAKQKAKNDAWKAKNLPKLAAMKKEKIEQAKKEQEEKVAKAKAYKEKLEKEKAEDTGVKTYLNVPYHKKDEAKEADAKWDAYVKQWYHTKAETPEGLKQFLPQKATNTTAKPTTGGQSLPKYGVVSEDDPSVYGSWLLGHEGEPWSKVAHLAPKPSQPAAKKIVVRVEKQNQDASALHDKTEVKPEPQKKPEPEPKKFKNYGWKAIELAKHYTIRELEAAMEDVKAEHAGTGTGIHLYDKAGDKKLDALSWAITHIAVAQKKAAAAQPKPTEQAPKEDETKQGADGTLVFHDGRWHKQAEAQKAEQKPATKEQPKGDAASKLTQIPWDGMLLPDSNKNAKSHNKQVAKIKAMAEAGDIEGLKNFKAGVNTYGKKQNLLAQTALAALEESAPAPKAEEKPAQVDAKSEEPVADGKPQKPTGLSSVGWTSMVNYIEQKMAAKDVTPIAMHAKQTEGLTSPEAKQVHDYANAAVEYLFAQAAKGLTENDGPQEGETKQGADGMLVFKNGRWHKHGDDKAEEKPAPAGPADVEIPVFTGLSPSHTNAMTKAAVALKAKITAEGKAGFKSVLTNHKDGKVTVTIDGIKIGKASVTSSTPAFAAFAKFVDELKASTGAVKKEKAAPKAKSAPAPAAEPEQQKSIESMDSWTQTGEQAGSNPGGKFKDENGVEWYCKFPPNEDHAKAEVLAAKLYTALGLNAQDAKLVIKDGKIGIASRWQAVKKASPKELAKASGALSGFAADAWLGNWDVVGLEYDNLQVDDNGNAMRVDAGGSLMYRAQGGKKAFGEHVTELDSLRDAKINPQAAAVFGKMSKADITASVAKVANISDAQIRIIVNANGPGTKEERKALADTLIARKNDLIAKFPKAVKAPKKRLDPTNLPVPQDQLPKRHDFANWNGVNQPLSSKSHVNDANQQVENEMLDIAKSGNLTKLKEYKFQPVDKDTGKPVGDPKPIDEHPSKHVVQYHSDLVQLLDEIANPPQPLKIFQESDVNTLDQLEAAFPPKKFGTTVGAVHSNEKLGFWVVLGGVHGAEKFIPKKVMNLSKAAIESAYTKFKEASKLAKHFVQSVQASGSYNDLFRDGKETDGSGNKLSDVAKAALEFATEQPEGTSLYRWQNMSDDMVKKVMSAPDGSVFQATGPMCTSYSPTATSHFGKHRVTFRYAKGAKAVESFGSGSFAGEKEVTTLPNSRFVILKKEMVPNEKGSGQRLELEVLMLPPDLGL